MYSKLNIEDTLSVQELDQLRAVVSSFSDVFAMDQSELGRTDLIKHSIDTGEQGPVKQLPYRTPFSLRGKMEEMISQMLEQGVIKPSNSPMGKPSGASGQKGWNQPILCRLSQTEFSDKDGHFSLTSNR